jgi:hypothetical protein
VAVDGRGSDRLAYGYRGTHRNVWLPIKIARRQRAGDRLTGMVDNVYYAERAQLLTWPQPTPDGLMPDTAIVLTAQVLRCRAALAIS